MDAKVELRRALKERLTRLSENDRRVESQIIDRELRKLLPQEPCIIAAYAAYLDEPNLSALISALLGQSFVICMGKASAHGMSMHRVTSLSDIHRNPVTNILEPAMDRPVNEADIAVAIVPGRAFTPKGARMGRGNGGYDRWIREQRLRNPSTRMIGICFDCQVLSEIPMESHDEVVDVVVTASKVHWREG